MRVLRYAVEEAAASLWRSRRSGVLSTATIAVAIFVLGAFLLLTSNLQRLGVEWARTAELSVYLHDEATPAERAAIEEVLASDGTLVADVEFVTKDQALTRFRELFADLAGTLDTLGDNPLPASYEVRLRAAGAPAAVEGLAAALLRTPGVADVRYDRQWLERLIGAVSVLRAAGLALGAILTLAAALTVASVVKLALYARRDELEIMQLVGAPEAYIRGPFVVEGVLQGGLGAVLALGGLAVLFTAARGPYLTPLAAELNLPAVHFLPPELSALLLGGGMAVGCVGGLVAALGRAS
jgi:cell division transport system permease protein